MFDGCNGTAESRAPSKPDGWDDLNRTAGCSGLATFASLGFFLPSVARMTEYIVGRQNDGVMRIRKAPDASTDVGGIPWDTAAGIFFALSFRISSGGEESGQWVVGPIVLKRE